MPRLLSLIPLLLLSACAVNPVTGQGDFVLMSESQEVQLGRSEHPKILKQYHRYDIKTLQQYVNRIGQRLARNSHRPHLKYTFTVLDSTEVNAFALPGGYIYITRGLLAYLNSEAELAAVLGHELGHVTARHGVRQYSAATATNLGFTLGSLFVPELRNQAAQDLFSVLNTALLRGYGREHELEADRLGSEYLARSGYETEAMISVIRVLKNQELFEIQRAREENREPRVYHGVFSSHPDNDQRLQEVVAEGKKYQDHSPTRRTTHEQFLSHLDGLVFGPSESEGILHGRDFYHKELDFALRFPEAWKVHNQPERLISFAPEQAALLQMELKPKKKGQTLRQFLLAALKLDEIEQGAPLTLENLQGYSGQVWLKTSFGTRKARVAAIDHPRGRFLFVGLAKEKNTLQRFETRMLATIKSFHRLKADEQAQARALRLALISADTDTRFEQLARTSKLQHHAEEQLRLLNDRYPKGQPTPGMRLKIVK